MEDGTLKKLIVGNWKMHGTLQDARALIADVVNTVYGQIEMLQRVQIVVCPSFLFIPAIRHAMTTVDLVTFGGQDCSQFENGAYTGDTSATMLEDGQCDWVVLGHSERRTHFGETNEIVSKKVSQVHKTSMTAIVCVGETEEERKADNHEEVVAKQLVESLPDSASAENTVVAYEPVWAIGTGNHARNKDIEEMHAFIRKTLAARFDDGDEIRLLYGGSVKPENADDIFSVENVDGALIGGASLDAEGFVQIAESASK